MSDADDATLPAGDVGTPSERALQRDNWLLARGDTLGRYFVLDLLGRGGMGAVYSAYDPELDRKVAIKLIRARADPSDSSTGADQHRLQREAQAIAQLSHPNVLTVHDVGTHRGRVFVTMEYVEGGTLREWADAGPHPWREVLARYLPAGQGLAAAHRAGLVHRDFKPANVLIGKDGRLRVADFGLARRVVAGDEPIARPREPSARSLDTLSAKLTQTGARVGTPAYMAPEQYAGEEVDARADQFAFCVALYEALYAERPFVARTMYALIQAIDRGEISEPPRGTKVPGSLRKLVIRGLARAPAQRWPDMDALLLALQDLAASRSRRPWSLVAGSLIAITTALAFVIVDERRPSEPAICTGVDEAFASAYADDDRRAIEQRLRQLDQAATLERLLPRLDQWAASWRSSWESACRDSAAGAVASELHSARLSCLERRRRRFASYVDLLVDADAELARGAIEGLDRVGNPAACSESERVLAQVEPPEDPELRAAVEQLAGQLDEVHAQSLAGRLADAEAALDRLAAPVEATRWRPLLAEFHHLRGHERGRRRDFAGSESDLLRAIADALAVGDDRLAVLALAEQAEFICDWQPRWTESLGLLELADALVERLGGDEALATEVDRARAEVLMRQGSYAPAVAAAERSLAAAERAAGPESLLAADAQYVLGTALFWVGDADEGMRRLERARALWTAQVGPENPRMLKIHNGLGLFALEQDRPLEAIDEFAAELRLAERLYGPEHLNVSDALTNLANAHYAAGQLAEARRDQDRALAIRVREAGPDNLYVGHARVGLAGTLRELGLLDEALAQAEQAHAVILAVRGEGHGDLAIVGNALAEIHRDRGELDQAREWVARSLALVLAAGDNPDNIVGTRLLYGEIELAAGDAQAALEQVEQIREQLREQPEHSPTLDDAVAFDWLAARSLARLGRIGEARELGEQARRALGEAQPEHERIAEIDAWLAALPPG
ncbi:protein kinase domain-containing protein [Nannocystaceae bacterium ST9]